MAYQLSRAIKEEQDKLLARLARNDLHGKDIYILGSAEFGPTNEPMLVKSTVGLHNKFGFHGSLIDAWHAIKYVSRDNNIYCVKTTGRHAQAFINVNTINNGVFENGMQFYSSQSNELFNDVRIIIDISYIKFEFPSELGIAPISYKYKDYPTVGRLVHAINSDTRAGRSFIYAYFDVEPSTPTQDAFYAANFPNVFYMYGGECGINYSKNMLYNCLSYTYYVLESHPIDVVVPVDAFLDDVHPYDPLEGNSPTGDNPDIEYCKYGMTYYHIDRDYLTEDGKGKQQSFLNQLINFCIRQMNFGIITTGVMGFTSNYKYWSKYLSESDKLGQLCIDCYNII